MNVGVIGAGNMGRSIARRLVEGGHTVFLRDEDQEKAFGVAHEVSAHGPGHVQPVGSAREAATSGEVVILATWFPVSTRLAVELSDVLAGRLVVEISNPFNDTFDDLITEPTTSAAEEIARRIPGVRLVKAFNTTFAPVLFDGGLDGKELDVLLASDDDGAKRQVAQLVRSAGMRPIDAGKLKNARTLERLTLLLVELQGRYDLGFQATLKLLPEKIDQDPLAG